MRAFADHVCLSVGAIPPEEERPQNNEQGIIQHRAGERRQCVNKRVRAKLASHSNGTGYRRWWYFTGSG